MLDEGIFIKGNREGIIALINMDKFKDFDEMLEKLLERLNSGKQFYVGATLTFIADLKHINDKQMRRLKDVLFDEIMIKDCIFQEKEEKESKTFTGVYEGRTKFIRKTVRGGQSINYPGNIVIIGDINNGAEVSAAGNIIVLGSIKGQVHAGINGNKKSIIAAFMLQPEILSIGNLITISPEGEKPTYPEVAKIKDGEIVVEPYLPNKYISTWRD
ncbi:septum site-determining protein MinC [Clostridium fungisolvens]|uniref:Probable septum site-determining protein MinC n=1 Tax=Clostridium fungisolvens TaxID=1604897 RepID=A0A6V8SPW9_9CLOT|nr:septum site-determining protein MinC [Clostridium fungisolvens]GFP77268.1 septum site-determining protein MinC [Clostridium fungisolvens]